MVMVSDSVQGVRLVIGRSWVQLLVIALSGDDAGQVVQFTHMPLSPSSIIC